jgi:hypothetical protein
MPPGARLNIDFYAQPWLATVAGRPDFFYASPSGGGCARRDLFILVFVDSSETLMVGSARRYVGLSIRDIRPEVENAGKQIEQALRLEWRTTADVTARVILLLQNPGNVAVVTRGHSVAVGAYDPPSSNVC